MEDDKEECAEEFGLDLNEDEEPSALLIGIYSGQRERVICEEHLDELKSLAETFGLSSSFKLPFAVRTIDAATFIPRAKVVELKTQVETARANLVIFDEEISPAQQRNLEKELKVAVMDRTELILEIFAQRAQTKEAQLQIELARTKYEFPRLKRLWSHFSRQRARGGYLKGEGEKQIEIDRRLLKRKLEKLQGELKIVQRTRELQGRARRRAHIPTFAIIGYTNAGKSTLLHALTKAEVLIEDKLFATLDPTTRKFTLPNHQDILLTDTVGFIRKLPHTLVAAFRSTLESALHDDVLIHIIDASHPQFIHHAETTYELLDELNIGKRAMITLLNKVDLCQDKAKLDTVKLRFPKAVVISALQKTGFDELLRVMEEEIRSLRQIVKLKIPQSDYALVALIKREGRVLYEEYEENNVLIKAEIPLSQLPAFAPYRLEDGS